MENIQRNPVKLYIQDIFRAKRSEHNKYIYEIFGLTFKNIMIHGVVTSLYNTNDRATNLELSDATGSVQIYYDSTKNNSNISKDTIKDLLRSFANSQSGDDKVLTMSAMLDKIVERRENPFDFQEGSYLNVVGDIFLDDIRNTRMVSAYQCRSTTLENDIIWLEELRYLYEKFYLWDKV